MKKFFDLFKCNKHEADIEEEERKQALSNAFGRMLDCIRKSRQIDNDIWYN
jgi:hypothetical protein